MKKIINGKRYDTESAELIGSEQYSHSGDLSYCREELYKKRTGEFFLYGVGGPISKYARNYGTNQVGGSEEIRPLTLDEAQSWAEKYLDGDEYEKAFGEVEEDKAQVATWIPISLKEAADRLREEKGYTLADIFAAGVKALEE